MKLTLENFCEECKTKTIWDYRVTKIRDEGEPREVKVYQCRGCKLYSGLNYLREMNER